jgi:predicted nuclease of predicted toxin-antitoxin system
MPLELKFKLDENLPIEAASLFSAAGHDALAVPQQLLGGQPDPNVAAVYRSEGRAVVTLDLDFADIRLYPPTDYPGIVVFRLARLDKHKVLAALKRLISVLNQEQLAGKLWIAEETRIRIRS